MYLLGIETSCDETAVAVVNDRGQPLSDLLASQYDLHKKFGGVVPEIASRRHVEVIDGLIQDALVRSGKSLHDVSGIAVTTGPGLIGALLVGVSIAKSLGYTRNIPVIPVHHLEGHIAAVFLERSVTAYPAIALVASGGHTNLYTMPKQGTYQLLGKTFDDAAGEAFDKGAKMLSLEYPGGPALDKLARSGDPDRISFPRPHRSSASFNFSFSGLKTALRHYLEKQPSQDTIQYNLPHIAAGYQEAIVDVLVDKSIAAARKQGAKTLMIVGGVAANHRLRERITQESTKLGLDLAIPSPRYCTDNGAMIAIAGLTKFQQGNFASLDLNPQPNLELSVHSDTY